MEEEAPYRNKDMPNIALLCYLSIFPSIFDSIPYQSYSMIPCSTRSAKDFCIIIQNRIKQLIWIWTINFYIRILYSDTQFVNYYVRHCDNKSLQMVFLAVHIKHIPINITLFILEESSPIQDMLQPYSFSQEMWTRMVSLKQGIKIGWRDYLIKGARTLSWPTS